MMNNQNLPMFKLDTVESKDDIRDVYYHQVAQAQATIEIPPIGFAINYSNIVHDNQRAIGICTAADMADMLQRLWFVQTGQLIEFSEQFIYVVGKKFIDGDTVEGSSLRTMFEVLRRYGAPPKSMVSTDDTRKSYQDYINVSFSPAVYAEALKYKIPGYARVDLDPISFGLALSKSQAGIATRMTVGTNLYTDVNNFVTWDGSKISPLRAPKAITGGHSIKVIKYTGLDNQQLRTARNTWGDSKNLVYPGAPVWGNNGDIDYVYQTQAPYVTEAWVALPMPVMTAFKHKFLVPINYGDSSAEVVALQRVLTILGYLNLPSNVPMGYYGDLTAKAILNLGIRYSLADIDTLTQLAGKKVGPAARLKLNELQGL